MQYYHILSNYDSENNEIGRIKYYLINKNENLFQKIKFHKKPMNKKPKLTKEQRQLMYIFSKKGFTDNTLKIRISEIKNNKITMSDISYFDKRYFELFDGNKDQLEFFTACEQEKDKLQQELNEIN